MISIKYIVIDHINNGLKLEKFILKHYKCFNYTYIQKLIRTGQIRVNKKRIKLGTNLYCGDVLRLPISDELSYKEQLDLKPRFPRSLTETEKTFIDIIKKNILYEDPHILAINKPAGLATQGGKNVKTSINKLLPYIITGNTSLKIVHRLDMYTSGVLLLAKTNAGAKHIFSQFKDHKIQKTYRCLVQGYLVKNTGTITDKILKLNDVNNKSVIDEELGKKASTFYKTLAKSKRKYKFKNQMGETGISYLEILPKTGRSHQIRVHLAEVLNTPILGDIKYGFFPLDKSLGIEKDEVYLHAYRLKLINVDNQEINITAPLDNKWLRLLKEIFD